MDVILPQALYNGVLGAACLLAMTASETVRAQIEWRSPRGR